MRRPLDRDRLERFLELFGRAADRETQVFLTGGACAVWLGWRASTLDVDLLIEPESDRLLRAIPALKEQLELNIELASPIDFIPAPPGWAERSLFIERHGKVSFYHFDFYSQALAKIERDHARDRLDVMEMFRRNLIDAERLAQRFAEIEPELYRFPSLDPAAFRRAVLAAIELSGDLSSSDEAG